MHGPNDNRLGGQDSMRAVCQPWLLLQIGIRRPRQRRRRILLAVLIGRVGCRGQQENDKTSQNPNEAQRAQESRPLLAVRVSWRLPRRLSRVVYDLLTISAR